MWDCIPVLIFQMNKALALKQQVKSRSDRGGISLILFFSQQDKSKLSSFWVVRANKIRSPGMTTNF
jgi:hypothetical protein